MVQGPSAYQPNALLLGQTGSWGGWGLKHSKEPSISEPVYGCPDEAVLYICHAWGLKQRGMKGLQASW